LNGIDAVSLEPVQQKQQTGESMKVNMHLKKPVDKPQVP
jgi:hypothetical protein